MYPGIDPGSPGSDCAGVVTHTAAGFLKHNLRVGDVVMGLAHGCLGTAIVAPAATLVKLPPGLSPQVCIQYRWDAFLRNLLLFRKQLVFLASIEEYTGFWERLGRVC